jgi:hypothetical protein
MVGDTIYDAKLSLADGTADLPGERRFGMVKYGQPKPFIIVMAILSYIPYIGAVSTRDLR